MAFNFIPRDNETFIQRVCREATERDEYIVSHPTEFPSNKVATAISSINDRKMLQVCDILRYS